MSMQRLLAALTALLLLLGCAAAETSGDYEYTLEGGKAVITAYSGTQTALAVPAALDGHPVGAIGEWAFSGHYELSSITLPEGLTAIGDGAFFSCDALTSVSLPESLTAIGENAFYNCASLQAFAIPASVTSLTGNPFIGCTALTELSVAAGNPVFEARSGLLYRRADNTLLCWPQGLATGACTVPAGTAAIGSAAFMNCEEITEITLPEGVTALHSSAFRFCLGLTAIRLPAGITVLEDSVFEGCSSLQSINLPEGLAAIPAWLLRDCDSLTAVTVPDGAVSIGMDAFEFSDSLQRMTLPGSLTEISVFAFNDCPALTDVYFCGTQSQWDALAIDDFNEPLLNAALHFPAARPADVDLPEDLTVIERDAFADLAGGTVVYFPEGVAEIDYAAFPPADSANPIILIAHPGSYAEAWGVRNGYTVWFPAP